MGNVTHEKKKKQRGWDTRRKAVSVIAAFMALLFLIPLVMELFQYAGAVTLDEISSLSAQQEKLEKKKDNLQSKLDDLKGEEQTAVSQYNLLGAKISVLQDQIATTQDMVTQYADQVKKSQKELKQAKEKEADYYDLFCQRVRNMEENGTESYWGILFGASGFSDLLDRVSFVSGVMDYDNQVLKQLKEVKQTVSKATAEIKEKKNAKEAALQDLKQQQQQISGAAKDAETVLKEIRSNQDTYAVQMEQADTLANSLASDIVSAKADYAAEQQAANEKAAAEKAAAKKAAQKAKKKSEAAKKTTQGAAKKEQQTQQTTEQSNADSEEKAEDQTTEQSSSPKEQSESSTESSQQPEEESVSPSAGGGTIVSYAMQFVGGRYVWGGENLSTGVDCSGFVMCVYKHFGYTLPHYSGSLADSGRGVSYSNAQLGDVICYNGHCGIYIGGGKMVNALCAKYGIVVSRVNTGRLVAVRRII